jgi:hypothetical protein
VFQPWGDVLLDASFLVGDAEDAFQLVEVVVGGGSHHLALGWSGERQQVGEKSLAEVKRQIVEGAASAAILLEVLVSGVPVAVIVIVRHLGSEILKKTLLAAVAVEKSVFLVDDGFGSATFDKLGIAEHGLVELSLEFVFRVGIDVYSQILPSCRLSCLWMPYSRVEVKVKRHLTVLDGSLPYSHFRADVCHIS